MNRQVPSVSVIICTRNRADSLRETLDSVTKCIAPEGQSVELLIVDNGSTDATADVIARMSTCHMEIRHIFEATPGQTHARNRGLREARGRALLWTDDDVRVPATWIVEMTRPLLMDVCDAVAGPVRIAPHLLKLADGTPLESRLGWVASTHGIDFTKPERMVGANMGFSRSVLERVPEFDTNLGPGPNSLGFYDETLFWEQLKKAGFRLGGVDGNGVTVEHHFDISRLQGTHLIDIAKRMGRSSAHFDRALGRVSVRHPLALVGRAHAVLAFRCLLSTVRGGARSRLEARIDWAQCVGYLRYLIAAG